jgi:propionyl-CoA carboxylase alpha chain
LARLLENTRIQGLTTNRDFLVSTLRTPEFIRGETTTDFIETVRPSLVRQLSQHEVLHGAIACVMYGQAQRRATAKVLGSVPSGWRNTVMPYEQREFEVNGECLTVEYRRQRSGGFKFRSVGAELLVTLYYAGGGNVDIEIDELRCTYAVDQVQAPLQPGCKWLVHGAQGDLELTELPRFPSTQSDDAGGGLMAPMPGVVVSTEVKAGAAVKKGDLLMVLEAMKMEHRIVAPRDGIIGELHVSKSEQVANGQLLVQLVEPGDDEPEDKGQE